MLCFDVTYHRPDSTVEVVEPSLLIGVMSTASALSCLQILHTVVCSSCSCTSFKCLTPRGKHATLPCVATASSPHRKHAVDVSCMLQSRSRQCDTRKSQLTQVQGATSAFCATYPSYSPDVLNHCGANTAGMLASRSWFSLLDA
jgi:hypothetical protein